MKSSATPCTTSSHNDPPFRSSWSEYRWSSTFAIMVIIGWSSLITTQEWEFMFLPTYNYICILPKFLINSTPNTVGNRFVIPGEFLLFWLLEALAPRSSCLIRTLHDAIPEGANNTQRQHLSLLSWPGLIGPRLYSQLLRFDVRLPKFLFYW